VSFRGVAFVAPLLPARSLRIARIAGLLLSRSQDVPALVAYSLVSSIRHVVSLRATVRTLLSWFLSFASYLAGHAAVQRSELKCSPSCAWVQGSASLPLPLRAWFCWVGLYCRSKVPLLWSFQRSTEQETVHACLVEYARSRLEHRPSSQAHEPRGGLHRGESVRSREPASSLVVIVPFLLLFPPPSPPPPSFLSLFLHRLVSCMAWWSLYHSSFWVSSKVGRREASR